MKKLLVLVLSMCLSLTLVVPFASAAESTEVTPSVVNERVEGILKENNIAFRIEDGTIKLNQTSPAAIAKANSLLSSQFQFNRLSIAASYPTPYQHMPQYDITRSKKFTAATKTAFTTAFTAWAKNIFTPWQEIVAVGVGGFAVYYFVNSDTEDIYTIIKYYYRELGPGSFSSSGTFIGDYEIKKEIRVTNNSNGTGGNVDTEEQEGSVLEPWF